MSLFSCFGRVFMQGKCACVTGNCKVVFHNFILFSFHRYLKCNAVQLGSVRKCDIFKLRWLHRQIALLFGWSLCLQLVMYLQLLMYLQLVVTGESTFQCSSFLRRLVFTFESDSKEVVPNVLLSYVETVTFFHRWRCFKLSNLLSRWKVAITCYINRQVFY